MTKLHPQKPRFMPEISWGSVTTRAGTATAPTVVSLTAVPN